MKSRAAYRIKVPREDDTALLSAASLDAGLTDVSIERQADTLRGLRQESILFTWTPGAILINNSLLWGEWDALVRTLFQRLGEPMVARRDVR